MILTRELAVVLASAGLAGYLERPDGLGLARRLRPRDLVRYLRRTKVVTAPPELPDERDDLLADDGAHLIVCQTRFEPGARFGIQRYVWLVRDDTEIWWRAELTLRVRRWTAAEIAALTGEAGEPAPPYGRPRVAAPGL